VALLALVLVLGACGDDTELGGTVVKDGLGCTITSAERNAGDVPVIAKGPEVADVTTTDDLTPGEKKACTADGSKFLTVDLIGATATDGTVFNTTYNDPQPLTLRLGQGQLIAGLEKGLDEMQVGARRQVLVPAAEAYGADGDLALGLGPDQDLVFVVDLISLSESPEFCNPVTSLPEGTVGGKPTAIAMPSKPAVDEVKTTVISPGSGAEAAKDSYLTVDYVGVSCATGAQFDSSWDNGAPITVALSDAEPTATAFSVIPGWTEGMIGQKEGSLIQIDIPFEQAYGSAGRPPSILPSDPLTFVVQIILVNDEPPAEPEPPAEAEPEAEAGASTTTTAVATTEGEG